MSIAKDVLKSLISTWTESDSTGRTALATAVLMNVVPLMFVAQTWWHNQY